MSALPVDMRRDEPNIAEAERRSVTVAAGVREPNVGLYDISIYPAVVPHRFYMSAAQSLLQSRPNRIVRLSHECTGH